MPHSPIIVVGAGAAGLMAAIFAAEHGRRVLLLERTRDGGRKILISGGGRCNVLPSVLAPERFVTDSSPNTLRNLLRSWPLADQKRFFEETLGLPLALEAETGKLFPVANQARAVRDALVAHARRRGVEFRFETRVLDVWPSSETDSDTASTGASVGSETAEGPSFGSRWRVRLEDGSRLDADAVILATGGLSVPATGSDGTGLVIARRLGHAMHETYPALTPLVADPPVHEPLSGVSLTVQLRASVDGRATTTTGGFLFTHRGYSGPSVLDISHTAVRARLAGRPQPVTVQWTMHGEEAWHEMLKPADGLVRTRLRQHLPDRLADWLAYDAGVSHDQPLATLTRDVRRQLVERLCRYALPWTGDEGYRKAEVTGGGVALDEVHPRTLESRRHPGLYLCGEMLDAFGPIGGHNFAWAWATGRLAGRAVAGPEA
jgi:predicted flavoprotein YhiN